ncbi:MAG: EpsG family protein [Clostridia bacterium]|nr:EpsG family protein [Clostridia bacterium]
MTDEKNRNWCIVLCGIIMALMVGLRHYSNGSGDSKLYYDLWERISKMDFQDFVNYMDNADLEGGFLMSNFVLSRVFPDPQFTFIFSGIFFAVSVSLFVKKNCKDVILPFVVFNSLGLFNFMVQGMRQAIAMCICLYAYEMAKKKKIIWFAVIIALAMTFHASAIVFAIAYIIRFFKLNFYGGVAFVAGSAIGIALLPRLFDLMNELMNEELVLGAVKEESSRLITILIHISIILFGILFYNFGNKKGDYAPFIYMAILCTMMYTLRNTASNIVERVSYYFMFAQMVLVSNAIDNIKNKRTKLFFYMLIIILLFALSVHKASYSILIPYEFMWK